jgi:hypothetical protein
MRHLLVLAATLSIAATAAAPAAEASEAEAPKAAPTILMSPVALPVVIDGRLANYIYVTLRLNLSPRADSAKLREKEPFFRDALLRAAYRTRLYRTDDPNMLDESRLRAAILGDAARIAGPGMVTGVQILRAQPQRFLPKPKTATAKG